MKLNFQLKPGFELQFTSGADKANHYPTARIQKGLILFYEGMDLSEEAVGLGVPILKRGLQTIFPSEADLYLHGNCEQKKVSARFKLNIEERLSRSGSVPVKNPIIYAGKNWLAATIRHIPFMRRLLTNTSNLLRSHLDLHTTYEQSDFSTYVVLTYLIDDANGKILVELKGGDFLSNSITEVILMNELGAHYFDQYQDSDGIYQNGEEISCWDPVIADEASFIDQTHKISFGLHQVQGARLYRGRELIEPRLAWSGFGYSFPPDLKQFTYTLNIKHLA
jgi:hypothetical protein